MAPIVTQRNRAARMPGAGLKFRHGGPKAVRMMGNVALVLFTVLLLQLCLAAAWGVGIRVLGMPRRPARCWMFSALACAMALALVLLRPQLPPALGLSLSNWLMVASAVFLVLGMRLFLHLPPHDHETRALLLLYLLCSGLAWPRIDQASGIGLQAVYVVVLLGAAWANFATKDIKS